MRIAVVTSNPHKAAEVAAYFAGVAEVEHVRMDIPEYRDNEVANIAREKARYAFEHLGRPCIVDDTAFSIDHLNGFPGPYAAYVLETIGIAGILRLMEGVEDRSAHFETAIGYADAGGEIHIFSGVVDGEVTAAPRGAEGFGYDPIFAVGERTFAEIPITEKSAVSHRGRALAAFRAWLGDQYP
ncbi:RdgB/HAM1 family non-canonical purine NTP pyrophosphatase [Methanofollis fontis]|uniref:dITP/XTP pyrophosphatase n=1 Tax=Methanofollis fontis TaxID=2052832 RepID=A0A483CWP3_9EURY|nr:RdgB/HAM1 family non-canonical purine NTP pyrophosphatase [Methanofollis fontis]TAJ45640.1 non-canonical purine NTP pyrophosphatase, RdgB/HAM1 family [Methanofollis fontis]